MPKYHFPIVDGTKLPDPTGVTLRDDEEAKQHARLIARTVGAAGIKADRSVVAVDDENNEVHREVVPKSDES
jgi:hypothetical protein